MTSFGHEHTRLSGKINMKRASHRLALLIAKRLMKIRGGFDSYTRESANNLQGLSL